MSPTCRGHADMVPTVSCQKGPRQQPCRRHVADMSPTCRVSEFLRLFADTTWPTYPTKVVAGAVAVVASIAVANHHSILIAVLCWLWY